MGEWMEGGARAGGVAGLGVQRPLHSGRILRRIRFEDPRPIHAAEQLGVECGELERALDGKAPIAPELALRMESVWHARAGPWLDLQTDYDSAQKPCPNAAA